MKKVKLILPVAAFLCAFIGSLAATNNTVLTAYYGTTENCQPSSADNDCSTTNTGSVCKITGTAGFGSDAYAEGCIAELKKP